MMKPLCFLLIAGSATAAQAQALEPWALPDADASVKASQVLCLDQAKATLMAASLRAKGHSKAEVLSLVPQSPTALSLRVVSAMRESAEDAFDFPNLSPYTQYSFRSEACFRDVLGALRMPRLATVLPQLEKCEKTHGAEKSNALFQCVRSVVRDARTQP